MWVKRKKALSQCRRDGGAGRVPRARRSLPLWGSRPSLPTTENPEAPIYGRRIRAAPAPAGGCRQRLPSICGTSADSKNSGTSIYGSRIRVLFGGSRWLSARPTDKQLGPGTARWRPTVVARTRGSMWQSARPARLTSGWGADRCGGGRGGRSRTGFPPPRGARPRRRCTRPRRSARAPRRSAER